MFGEGAGRHFLRCVPLTGIDLSSLTGPNSLFFIEAPT
jgi:hypothetical protein